VRALVTTLLALALLAGGCATEVAEPASEAPGTDRASGARETDRAGDVTLDIRMFEFEHEVVEIRVGETVTWTNQDATRHTVTSGLDGEPDGAFEVTLDGRDETASVTFEGPGEYHYFCAPHPFMSGTVAVVE
jgi:plastocyanin